MKKKTTGATEEGVGGKVLLLTLSDGKEMKVTIPNGARVTFGPTAPYQRKPGGWGEGGGNSWSVRVYASKANDSLLAVFSGVAEFRPIDMPCSKLVIKEAGKSLWKSDETGYEVQESVERKSEFVDAAKLLGS